MNRELKLQNCRLDGRFDIVECLGRGSYSEIYRAHVVNPAPGADREVVVKALNVFLQGTPEHDLERTLIENFQNEALALDRVRHPNIIRRVSHGTALDLVGQPFHYLMLEYLPGGDLYKLCRTRSFRLENALYYLEQVCAGLAHAHACGIIHRDIKPQNLLLTADRRTVKIADFGVAKLNMADEQVTRVGTNAYAPPEHSPSAQDDNALETRQRLTPSADIYSLSKTAYTLLAGESPRRYVHRPIGDLPPQLMSQHWGPAILQVLRKATQSAIGDRYANVPAFWEALADAALQATKAVNVSAPEIAAARHEISRELTNVPATTIPAAPPRPRFESATALQQDILPQPAGAPPSARARVVVPVGTTEFIPPPPPAGPLTPPGKAQDIIAALPDEATPQPFSRRSTRLLVAVALVLLFVGMLLATNYYVKNYWNKTNTPAQQAPNNPSRPTQPTKKLSKGDEGVVSTPGVNLRTGPGTSYRVRGVIGKNSRVRVVSVGDSEWVEVEVVEYVKTSGDRPPADQGWLNSKNVDFD